jgi:hypothetical protein
MSTYRIVLYAIFCALSVRYGCNGQLRDTAAIEAVKYARMQTGAMLLRPRTTRRETFIIRSSVSVPLGVPTNCREVEHRLGGL